MKHSIFARIMSLLLIAAMLCPVLALAEEKAEVAVTLPKSLVTIDAEAFKDTAAFGKVIVQNNTKRIESRAFANSAAKEIHLPASVEYIADDAFEGCENLILYVPQGSYAHQWAAFGDVKYVAVSETATAKKYALSGLEFADGVAAVNVTTDAACVLRVNVLKEADESVLLSCTAAAEAKIQDAAMEVPVEGTLPAYFILEAVLEDASGKALCEPLRDIRHSQAYANAMAAEPGDYPAERVIDFGDAGYMVLAEGVTNITADVTASGNHYTIPTSAFGGDLPEVGDVLMLNVGGTPTPVKIGSIAPSKGDSIRIEADAELYMCDAFDSLKINGYVETNGNGVGTGTSITLPLNETYTSENKMLTITATGGVTVYINALYNKKMLGPDYFMFDTETKALINIDVNINGKWETETDKIKIDLYSGVIVIPGLNIPAKLSIYVPLNGSIEGSGTTTFHYEKMIGFTWDSNRGFVEKEESGKNYIDTNLQVDLWAEVGPKLALDIGIWDFFGAKLDAQVGLEANGTMTGQAHVGYEEPVDAEEIHACNLCLGLDVDIFAEGNGNIYYKISKKCKGDLLKAQIFRVEGDLFEKHWSILNDFESCYEGLPAWGDGPCPNYKYKVKFETKGINDKEVKDIPLKIVGAGGKAIELVSPGTCHLYPQIHSVYATFPSGIYHEYCSVTGPKQTITITEKGINIDVRALDKTANQPLEKVKVDLTLPDGTIRTAYTDAEGFIRFEKLLPGKYSVVFTKDGYGTQRLDNMSLALNGNNNITMLMSLENLPVLEAFTNSAGSVKLLALDGTLPAEVPEVWLDVSEDGQGHIDKVTIRHEECTSMSYAPQFLAQSVKLSAINMGNGEYTFVLELTKGRMEGSDVILFREENGGLKILKKFCQGDFTDNIGLQATFTDNDCFSGTILPSNVKITGETYENYEYDENFSFEDRTGMKMYSAGLGYPEICYRHAYDSNCWIEYRMDYYCRGDWDYIGEVKTKYVMENNELVLKDQWFEPYYGDVMYN